MICDQFLGGFCARKGDNALKSFVFEVVVAQVLELRTGPSAVPWVACSAGPNAPRQSFSVISALSSYSVERVGITCNAPAAPMMLATCGIGSNSPGSVATDTVGDVVVVLVDAADSRELLGAA